MYLSSDKQTLNDLSIIESNNEERTIFSLYKKAETDGGNRCLENWIIRPLKEEKSIKERSEAIFCSDLPVLEVDRDEMDFIEFYLEVYEQPARPSFFYSWIAFVRRKIKITSKRYIIDRGSKLLEQQIRKLRNFTLQINESHPSLIQEYAKRICAGIESTELRGIIPDKNKRVNSYHTDKIDYLFRYQRTTTIREFLDILYAIDAIQTLRNIAAKKGYCQPFVKSETNQFSIKEFYHPHLKQPVRNSWMMGDSGICLFTGSNMAGKSTALKAIALCIWLAHCGFPVPADSMECPLLQGVFVSINLPDSLREGRSHFYTEVLRIKEIMNQLDSGKKYFIVFDELFKGTNAKDTFEASDAIVELLKQKEGISSLISTHVIELALKYELDKNCCFYYLESEINDNQLICYHKLREGISESRVGYWIVRKELFNDFQSS